MSVNWLPLLSSILETLILGSRNWDANKTKFLAKPSPLLACTPTLSNPIRLQTSSSTVTPDVNLRKDVLLLYKWNSFE